MPKVIKLNGVTTKVFSATQTQHKQIQKCTFYKVSRFPNGSIGYKCVAKEKIQISCPYLDYCNCSSNKKITYEGKRSDFGCEQETNAKFAQVRQYMSEYAWGLWQSD